jgi:hypothetical protein
VAALAIGEDLQDRRRLSMAANGQQDPFFAPFHGRTIGARPALSMRWGHGRVRAMFPVLSRAARLQALVIAGLAAASVVAQWVYLMDLRGTGPVETVSDGRFFTILTMVLVVIAFPPFPSARRAASVRRRLRQ